MITTIEPLGHDMKNFITIITLLTLTACGFDMPFIPGI